MHNYHHHHHQPFAAAAAAAAAVAAANHHHHHHHPHHPSHHHHHLPTAAAFPSAAAVVAASNFWANQNHQQQISSSNNNIQQQVTLGLSNIFFIRPLSLSWWSRKLIEEISKEIEKFYWRNVCDKRKRAIQIEKFKSPWRWNILRVSNIQVSLTEFFWITVGVDGGRKLETCRHN
jgi:hypothetical protein